MKGKGCTRVGVCGKTPEVAALQDLLIHTLKGLSIASVAGRKVNISDKETNRFTCMAIFSTLTNVEFDPYRFEDLLFQSVSLRDKMIQRVTAAGGKVETTSDAVTLKLKTTLDGMVKQAKNYGLMSDPDVNPDIRSLQHMLLFGIKGIPRLLDVGQCNDAHSAVLIAVALTKAFDTDVNGLPLSFIISWYEQKAVAVLLSLLHLGIKDIHLGSSLPAFVTPNVLDVLVKNYNLTPIGTPEGDLKKILA